MFKNKKTNIIISLVFKVLIILFCIIGVVSTSMGDNYMSQKLFLYFTIQSNLWIAFISLIFLVLEIIKIKKPDLKIPNFLYQIKFIFTVAISLTFLVFSIFLTPSLIINGQSFYLTTIENICLHNLVPILAILDYCFFDFCFVSKKSTFVWGIVMPLYYLVFALSLSLFGVDFGDGAKAPYFFLDYSTNGWFSLGGGKLGTFFWIIIILIIVLLLSLLLIWLKNKCCKFAQKQKNKD